MLEYPICLFVLYKAFRTSSRTLYCSRSTLNTAHGVLCDFLTRNGGSRSYSIICLASFPLCLLPLFFSPKVFRFDLFWLRPPCDHSWIRSESVHVIQTTTYMFRTRLCCTIYAVYTTDNAQLDLRGNRKVTYDVTLYLHEPFLLPHTLRQLLKEDLIR